MRATNLITLLLLIFGLAFTNCGDKGSVEEEVYGVKYATDCEGLNLDYHCTS